MLGRFVTHQRLLACVQSILVDSGIDEFTRMELFFEAIDLMEGLEGGIGSWRDCTNPSFAERELRKLKTVLAASPETERVVMERCERGVEALAALRDGFRDGQTRSVNALDDGIFKFLRALRNAGHGLKGRGSEPRCAGTPSGASRGQRTGASTRACLVPSHPYAVLLQLAIAPASLGSRRRS